MKRNFKIVSTLVITAIFLFASTGFADQKGTNVSADKAKVSKNAQAVADLSLAGKLAEYGRRVNNPTALVVAARIMKNTPAQDKKLDKATEGKETASKQAKKTGTLETSDKLLADAKKMAEKSSNEIVLAMIDKESKVVATRGKAGGPIRHVDRIMAGKTDIYRGIRFIGGEEAGVIVIGDGDCDLDLYVYDENDNLIEKDTDGTDRCIVTWTPSWTGPFTIKVKNYGSVYADYILVSN